jgi:RND family efflux transporter MFP subunit
MKRWRVLGMAPLAALLAACGGRDGVDAEARPAEAAVSVGVVAARTEVRTHALPGTVHPQDKAVIAAKLMATVDRADVVIGQPVEEGEVLVTLAAGEIVAQVEQAQAGLAQLERNLERERALLAQSATTAEAVRTLEDEIRQARARLMEAQTMEGYTRIRAPFDGIITSKEVRRGDLALPGVPLLNIEGKGNREVHVQVPDSLMSLPLGAAVEIEANGILFPGVLAEWSPAADPASRTRLAKLSVPQGADVRSGQYVRVNWPAREATALWMPLEALAPMGQLQRVFTLNNAEVRLQLVKTGPVREGYVQVLSGLNDGDRVVLASPATLRDGQPAKVQP